jgi:metal-responsive CopG/Arc/MetJ family transcriptional regulator
MARDWGFVAMRFPPELLEALDKLARNRFLSRSDCIRSLLWQQLQQLQQLEHQRQRERRDEVGEAAA